MQHFLEDNAKRRLTEPVDIEAAIQILKSRGYSSDDDLVAVITKMFYVDLDTLNEVLRAH